MSSNDEPEKSIREKMKEFKKKNTQRRQMPTEDLNIGSLKKGLDSFEQLYNHDYIIGEDQDLRRLAGKYERYYYDETKKSVIKDILSLQANRQVLVRSVTGIYRGFASYCVNAILSIHLFTQNDQQANSEQLTIYVGRYGYEELECLHPLCLTFGADNIPVARTEVLIPAQSWSSLPEEIKIESLAWFKVQHRYPHLLALLQKRTLNAPHLVTWASR